MTELKADHVLSKFIPKNKIDAIIVSINTIAIAFIISKLLFLGKPNIFPEKIIIKNKITDTKLISPQLKKFVYVYNTFLTAAFYYPIFCTVNLQNQITADHGLVLEKIYNVKIAKQTRIQQLFIL
uniref:hypothetical protein n=1 Tax=Lactococcus muris TaxID=2941330 RepID=UPI00389183CE